MDAGANASVLPAFSVASLVGFGAVVAALPAFALVRDWVLAHRRRPAGVARGRHQRAGRPHRLGLGRPHHRARRARARPTCSSPREHGIDPALLHRVAVIGAGTLDSLPHNGAVVTLLAVCGSTHARAISTSSWSASSARCWRWSPSSCSAACSDRSEPGAHLDLAPPCFVHRPGGRNRRRGRLRHSRARPGSALVRHGARPAARHRQRALLRRRRSCPDARRGCPCARARAGGIARRRPADRADAAGILSRGVRRRRQRRLRRRPHQRLDHHRHAARVQDRDRRQHRRPDRALCLSRVPTTMPRCATSTRR